MSKLDKWEVENEKFWESTGKSIASRNLWISIGCLLLAFCVWLMWSIITVQMKNLGFPFDDSQLFTLSAIAGLTGATLRIPNSFLVAIAGGRNIKVLTTALLILPAFGVGVALQDVNTPYSTFVILAALSGIGGGAFASSMSNISFFFPKKVQGLALGLNAGLGNIGVSVMQVLLPITMTFALFGAFGGKGLPLPETVGGKAAGTLVYIQNCGYTWVPLLILFTILSWFWMNNLPIHHIGSTFSSFIKIIGLTIIGYIGSAFGLYALLIWKWNMWIVLPVTIVLTVFLLKLVPGELNKRLKTQYAIFNNKHCWTMTILYTMTFGSFIGYSAAFPLFIKVIFGYLPDGAINPNAPNPFQYAWLGAFVGSVARPIGGWVSDKIGGAKINNINTIIMILSTFGVAYYVKQANGSLTPEQFFVPFLILFIILFITTGIGNGSNFRMVPMIFQPAQAGPVLGWISSVAAYGAFIIPKIFGQQVKVGTPEYALYGLAAFYVFCFFVNFWFYGRKGAEVEC